MIPFLVKEEAFARYDELVKTGNAGNLFRAVRLFHVSADRSIEELSTTQWE